jgi:hypothetical protein
VKTSNLTILDTLSRDIEMDNNEKEEFRLALQRLQSDHVSEEEDANDQSDDDL